MVEHLGANECDGSCCELVGPGCQSDRRAHKHKYGPVPQIERVAQFANVDDVRMRQGAAQKRSVQPACDVPALHPT